jgi:hypothetical protein
MSKLRGDRVFIMLKICFSPCAFAIQVISIVVIKACFVAGFLSIQKL